jgi:hypothetical protein
MSLERAKGSASGSDTNPETVRAEPGLRGYERKQAVLIPLALALIVTLFFWKLLTKQYTWMDHPDMAAQILPWLQFQADAWQKTGWFPLWDPNTWGGQPLMAQLVPGGTYPLNWPLFLLPFGSDGRIRPLYVHLQFILAHIMAAIFGYWFCRDLKRSVPASILGGLAFSLTGMVGTWGWPQMLHSSIWMPLPAMYLYRSVVRESGQWANAALCGFFTGLMFLGGHHQVPALFALLMGGMWAVRLWQQGRAAIPATAVFGTMTALAAGLQLIPAFEYGARSIRWVGATNPVTWGQSVPYNVHQDFQHSFYPSGVLGLVLPNLSDYSAFIGLTIVALALVGLAAGFRRFAEIPYIGAAGIAAALFAFGGYSIYHGVAYLFVPMVEKLRTPAMAFSMAQFALIVLAAYGVDAIRDEPERIQRRWMQILCGLGGVAWAGIVLGAIARPQTGSEYERLAVLGLMAFTMAGLLSARLSGAMSIRTVTAALVLTMLFEVGTVTTRDYHHREAAPGYLYEMRKHRDLIDYLKAQPGPMRIEYDLTKTIRYNVGDWDGVPQFEAYLAGLTGNIGRLVAAVEMKNVLHRIFAVNYYAGSEPKRPETQEEVFQSQSGVKLYRNTDALPRAWIVHEVSTAAEEKLAAKLAEVDLRKHAVLTSTAPALATCDDSGDAVSIAQFTPDRVEYRANLACRGMVVMSETWYPGWYATVDGADAKVYEADGAIRGVVTEAGAHTIVLRYRPWSVYLGAAMSLFAALIAGFVWFRLR